MKTLTRYARNSLEGRAFRLLRTLGTSVTMRAVMEAAGYDDEEHQEGWDLCVALGNLSRKDARPSQEDPEARAALVDVNEFVRRMLPRLAAGVTRRHPEHHAVLFEGLVFTTEAKAQLEATVFLERYDALVSRSRKADAHNKHHGKGGGTKVELAVVAFLAKRGLREDVLRGLRSNLVLLRGRPFDAAVVVDDRAALLRERDALLLKLQSWLDDWTSTARQVFRRRDELIRLGVGHRARKGKPSAAAPPVAHATAAASVGILSPCASPS